MDLRFYKLRICDADLILIDDLSGDGKDRDWQSAARALLHRRRGAGADRMAVISQAEEDIWLRVFRLSGEGGPIADAALCAARFLLDSGRSGAETVRLRLMGRGMPREIEIDALDSASLGLSIGPPRRTRTRGGAPRDRADPNAQVLPAQKADAGSEEGRIPFDFASLASTIEASGERFMVLPLRAGIPGSDAVAVFGEGGSARVRAKIVSRRGASAPPPLPIRVLSRGELRIAGPYGDRLDASAAGGIAVVAAASAGYADREALVSSSGGALWVEWDSGGNLYVAARPEYSYRGEFHLEE